MSNKGKRIKCEFCKGKSVDIIRHLRKCHRNPSEAPRIEVDWDYLEQYQEIKKYLIMNPHTEKAKEFNQILAPKGNPFEEFEGKMLNYANRLPKAHKDKAINQKLHEILTVGIELRLLNREEFLDKLFQIKYFLFDFFLLFLWYKT